MSKHEAAELIKSGAVKRDAFRGCFTVQGVRVRPGTFDAALRAAWVEVVPFLP